MNDELRVQLERVAEVLSARHLTDTDVLAAEAWAALVKPATRPFLESIAEGLEGEILLYPGRTVKRKRDGHDRLNVRLADQVWSVVSVGMADESDDTDLEHSLVWGLFFWGGASSPVQERMKALASPPFQFRTIKTDLTQGFPGTNFVVYRAMTASQLRVTDAERLVTGIRHDLNDLRVRFLESSRSLDSGSPKYWWVNQGSTYVQESAGGYVWAPQRSANGAQLTHHANVSLLHKGDRVIHYANGSIRSVGTVLEDAADAPRPSELPEGPWESDGRYARVQYRTLPEPMKLESIPVAWRIEESNPFDSTGGVRQGYMFPISSEFWHKLPPIIREPGPSPLLVVGAQGAPDDARITFVRIREMIDSEGREADWWSYPLQPHHKDALALHPYLYLYLSAPTSKITHRLHIVDFVSEAGPAGIESPWPEVTPVEDLGKKRRSDSRNEIFKTWFLVDSVEELEDPLTTNELVTSEGRPAIASALLGGFGLWKRKEPGAHRSWVFQANPRIFDLAAAVRQLETLNWTTRQHADEIHAGDIAYLWASGPGSGIVAKAQVTSEPAVLPEDIASRQFEPNPEIFDGESMRVWLSIDKVLDETLLRSHLLQNPKLQSMSILRAPQGTNFSLTDEEASEIERLLGASSQGDKGSTLEDLAGETHLSLEELSEIESLLAEKKQLILEGPPGSGKTYLARLFARYFTGNSLNDEWDERVQVVQFHQSYGYEEFIQGIRPLTVDGSLRYELQPGIFRKLCATASANPQKKFVLIIDEINRGNISRIFGELLYLLEYREQSVRLGNSPTEDPTFSIPDNVFLIGTMNTTDRSLAQIDYALRRRFFFYRLMPVVRGQAPVLAAWLEAAGVSETDRERLIALFVRLNTKIVALLGEHFQLGHSYLMRTGIERDEVLQQVWQRGVLPLLEEYFHNQKNLTELLDSFSIQRLLADAEPSN